MPTDKRARQKAGRISRLEEQRAAEARHQRRGKVTRIVAIVVGVLAVALLISLISNDSGSDVATDASTTTTVPETTSTTYSDPALAQEVLAREAPTVAPPPADLAKGALNVSSPIEGKGRAVQAGDTVVLHYIGVLPDGTELDNSYTRDQPFVGVIPGGVIDGWNEGLIGAKIGERRRLEIGSEKAYGASGKAPDVPPDTPIAFEMDIIDVIPAGG